jgi:hypothetical protein
MSMAKGLTVERAPKIRIIRMRLWPGCDTNVQEIRKETKDKMSRPSCNGQGSRSLWLEKEQARLKYSGGSKKHAPNVYKHGVRSSDKSGTARRAALFSRSIAEIWISGIRMTSI